MRAMSRNITREAPPPTAGRSLTSAPEAQQRPASAVVTDSGPRQSSVSYRSDPPKTTPDPVYAN